MKLCYSSVRAKIGDNTHKIGSLDMTQRSKILPRTYFPLKFSLNCSGPEEIAVVAAKSRSKWSKKCFDGSLIILFRKLVSYLNLPVKYRFALPLVKYPRCNRSNMNNGHFCIIIYQNHQYFWSDEQRSFWCFFSNTGHFGFISNQNDR